MTHATPSDIRAGAAFKAAIDRDPEAKQAAERSVRRLTHKLRSFIRQRTPDRRYAGTRTITLNR